MTTATLTAIQGGAQMFREEGFRRDYPTRESRPTSSGFGYDSDMMALAVNHDDAVAFMYFLKGCGGLDCEVFIAGNLANYAALHGARDCVDALFDAGGKYPNDRMYYLKLCDTPTYGPNAIWKAA